MTGEKNNNRLFPLIPLRTAAALSRFNVSGYKLCHNGLHKLRESHTTGDNAQLKIKLRGRGGRDTLTTKPTKLDATLLKYHHRSLKM